MDGCVKDFTKLIDSTASALLTATHCRLAGQNQTRISECLGYNFIRYLLLANFLIEFKVEN